MLLGLVGPPNVGKSTFLAASTGATVQIANYPFTTIDPNKGIGFATGPCPHPDFGLPHCNARDGHVAGTMRRIPVNMMDVAGLVPEAHLGKGKGIEFLGDLAAADGLLLVVDSSGSTDMEGHSKEPGSQNPVAQADFIDAELSHWIASILKRNADKSKGKKFAEFAGALTGLKVTETMLRDAVTETQIGENYSKWTDSELFRLATILRQRAKPFLIVANKADSPHSKKNVEELRKAYPRSFVVPCSADSELALKRAKEKGWIDYDGKEFTIKQGAPEAAVAALHKIRDHVFKEWNGTGVQQAINSAVFEMLHYMAIYPGQPEYSLKEDEGKILLDVFLMPPGSTAIDFAGRIHTDFAKNFIRAIDCRSKRTIGKDHVLKNGDVINIVAGR